MVFIVSDGYNAAKYTQRSHEFLLANAHLVRIDFCSDIPLFDAGVSNTLVHFSKRLPSSGEQTVRIRRYGITAADFDVNAEVLAPLVGRHDVQSVFRPTGSRVSVGTGNCVPLAHICFISKGMVINADEKDYQGIFSAEALLSDHKDSVHPKRFAFGKDIRRWTVAKARFLEWGTDRAPRHFSRKTFPELQEACQKLLAVRTPGSQPKVAYDDKSLFFDASTVGIILWDALSGVRNGSIRRTVEYRAELRDKGKEMTGYVFREQREVLSQHFSLKYVLAVMNSHFAQEWLLSRRRSKLHVYPDDWKQLPVPQATPQQQAAIVALVADVLSLFSQYGYPLPNHASARLAELEAEINRQVSALYGL